MSVDGKNEVTDKDIQEFMMNLLVRSDLEVITMKSIKKNIEKHFKDRGDLQLKQRSKLISKTLNLFIDSKAQEASNNDDELFNDDIAFDDDDVEIPRSENKAKNANAFTRPVQLSSDLSEFMGSFLSSRTAVVKKLWDYIKSNGLQNPSDKREILCDAALEKVFKRKKMTMFSMNKFLAVHIKSVDDLSEPKDMKKERLQDAKELQKQLKKEEKEIKIKTVGLEAMEKKIDKKVAKKMEKLKKLDGELKAKTKEEKEKVKAIVAEKVKAIVMTEKEKIKAKANEKADKVIEKAKAKAKAIAEKGKEKASKNKKIFKKRSRSGAEGGEDGGGGGDEPSVKKARGPGPGKGIHVLMNLSEELAAFLGVAQESRPQVVSKLWSYLRANNLQNPEKKTEIILDPTLKKIFHVDTMTMFSMNKLLSPHFLGRASVDTAAEDVDVTGAEAVDQCD